MKKKTLLITTLLTLSSLLFGAEKVLVCGSGWGSVALLDKASGTFDWEHKVPNAGEMNSICLTKDGNIAVSNKKNLLVLDKDSKELIWSYDAGGKNEIHSVSLLENGNLLVGMCAVPARILELDNNGKVVNTVEFDSGSANIHPQFRQISVAKNGNYIVPLYSGGAFLEVDKSGKIVNKVKTPIRLFSALTLKNGNILLSGEIDKADREKPGLPRVVEYSPKEGKIVGTINTDSIDGVKLLFVAQIRELENGNLLLCNYNGHSKDKTQPKILEIDRNNKLVWKLDPKTPIKNLTGTHILK